MFHRDAWILHFILFSHIEGFCKGSNIKDLCLIVNKMNPVIYIKCSMFICPHTGEGGCMFWGSVSVPFL